MNQYARMALSHWRRFLPSRYRQIPNPHAFFTELGRRAEQEIEDLTLDLAGPDLPGEGHLDKTGRLTAAKQQAREKVLAELILLAAEPGTEMDESDPQQPAPSQDDQSGEMSSDWIPTTVDPQHPFYRDNPPQ